MQNTRRIDRVSVKGLDTATRRPVQQPVQQPKPLPAGEFARCFDSAFSDIFGAAK